MSANRQGQTGRCKPIALALSAVAAILVLGAAPSAVAMSKPVTVKVREVPSVVKAPDGTITAGLVLKAKDPACLSAIPFERGSPYVSLGGFPGDTGLLPAPTFQMPAVGRAAYQLILPPETTVTIDVGPSPTNMGRERKQVMTSQATQGIVLGAFKNPNPRNDPSWQRKSKKLGRVICAPQGLRGEFPLGG